MAFLIIKSATTLRKPELGLVDQLAGSVNVTTMVRSFASLWAASMHML